MATVINEVTLEPKAEPPGAAGATGAAKSGGDGGGSLTPDVRHEIAKMLRHSRERAARLCAH